MAIVSYSSTYLASKGKKGILKPDDDGYYTLVVGGLNIHNSVGDYYTFEGAKELFENPAFLRRIQNGALKGEVGHPTRDGMTDQQFLDRFLTIRETNVCCTHAKVWLDFDSVKDSNGRSVIAVMSKVKPSGVHAKVLEDSLNDPNDNTAFSVRGMTHDRIINGVKHRVLKTIITWDMVGEPGLAVATKWNSPSLESLTDNVLDEVTFKKVEKTIEATNLATESKLLLSELTWVKEEFSNEFKKPIYTKW